MKSKPLIIAVIAAGTLALAIWGFIEGRKELEMEHERERPVNAPSRLSIEDGQSAVVLDQTTRIKAGITTMPLVSTARQQELVAYAAVLPFQELSDLRNAFAIARAQADKTRATSAASRREYERLQTLHDDDRNVSDKALQAAEAIWRADDAGTQAAREALAAVERNARQQWGDPLALAVTVGSPLFERLAARREILLQVSLPAGVAIGKPPQTARVQDANNSLRSAALVSPAQRTDARLQGASFFYVAEAEGLMPGMTVIVLLPVEAQAAQAQGVVVPASAVGWWQGKAWVYVAQQKDHFVRREIATDHPLEDGWFAVQGFAASEAVVIKGAAIAVRGVPRADTGRRGRREKMTPTAGWVAAIVRFSLHYRGVVIALACLLVGYGLYTASRAKYDVFPEFASPQATIQIEAPGLAPEQVEVLVTPASRERYQRRGGYRSTALQFDSGVGCHHRNFSAEQRHLPQPSKPRRTSGRAGFQAAARRAGACHVAADFLHQRGNGDRAYF